MGGYSFQLEYSIFSPKSKVHFMQPILKKSGLVTVQGLTGLEKADGVDW